MEDATRRAHPRPQLRRADWESLDGTWEFAFDREAVASSPADVRFDRSIEVPFAPETPRSRISDQRYTLAVWYRKVWTPPALGASERLVLHFGAVDHCAKVWIDGLSSCTHEGGYTPFSVDLTPHLREGRPLEIVVRAYDDPHDLEKPRGKQDWQLQSHSIWYPRTTGIWQTVWVERLPAAWISELRWSSSVDRWEIQFGALIGGALSVAGAVRLELWFDDIVLADDTYAVTHPEIHRTLPLSDPGIDDSRNILLWSPSRPTLIQARITLLDPSGNPIDVVDSYTALRSIEVQADQILLNGRPIRLKMVLAQGYWPDSGMTAPDDRAFETDIHLIKQMGFNGIRLHQKLEDPRFLEMADRLGLLVWVEMPSAYRFTEASVHRLVREWTEAIARDASHPCVIAWVPFNESWGVPNLPDNPAQRHYVTALYHLTKTLDPTRPVVGNDGWESVATDIVGVHDYDPDPESIDIRYHEPSVRPTLYRRQRYGGRLLVLDGHDREHPIVLSEFGGLSLADPDLSLWGYAVAVDPDEFAIKLEALFATVRRLSLLAGYCYTQLADTYQEVNGLLTASREPKIPLELVRSMNEGRTP